MKKGFCLKGEKKLKTPRTRKALFLTLLAALLLLPSCNAGESIVLIGNTHIDDEVYTYYLDAIIDGKGGKTSSDIIIGAAEDVRYYVKVNTSASKHGIVLSQSEKVELSERLSDFWAVYGEYYKKIGVSKQTVGKVFESEAYEIALLKAHYGESGDKEVEQSEVLSALNKYFIVFKSVNGYFSETKEGAETTELSEIEKELLIADYKNAANQINDSELTIEDAASRLQEDYMGHENETAILKKGSPYYPDSFFEEVAAAKTDTATVVVTDSNVFLVIKENIKTDSEYFTDNYTYALEKLKGEELKSLISSESSYQAHVSESRAESVYNRIIKVRGENV